MVAPTATVSAQRCVSGLARRTLTIDNDVAAELAGAGDEVLRKLEDRLNCDLYLRGNVITLDGEEVSVEKGQSMVEELVSLIESGEGMEPSTVDAVGGAVDAGLEPSEMLSDSVWSHRGIKVAPRTPNQKRYVDSIRRNTVSFGIGPAGTGKTFLAVAMAVAALEGRDVSRIILTRPAVEAGERLGFLPGDLQAKVDPYLRPLFDALYDMLDPERVTDYFDRGVIEIAPLAFMRGRAQPVTQPVLTPDGFRPIGELEVGDLVVGSDGRPTTVLGVYPQGRKPVVRVTAQDGASTVCCEEHLWAVKTPSDRRNGNPHRVLEAQEMAPNVGRGSEHHYELPVLTEPVLFPERDVPIDPYDLGLALGHGFEDEDVEPADAGDGDFPELIDELEGLLSGAPAASSLGGGTRVEEAVAEALRTLELEGVGAIESFVPEVYRFNTPEVRLATLQGLLDSDGVPVTRIGRSSRVQYRTGSERLRDDVTFLIRSLGGVVYSRPETDAGSLPRLAEGHPASGQARPDSFLLDIRLPDDLAPFRSEAKSEEYESAGGGQPRRFISAIEPAGEDETVCIQVAAADSLYVTDDFLLTHNTLNDSFVILDEAQNTSPEQMKMFLTRLGFGSRMVVTGDVTQIDLPRNQRSGLVVVSEILSEVDGVSFTQFGRRDVVRHELVQRIVEAYDAFGDDDPGPPRRPEPE